jgi:hypothetical protein
MACEPRATFRARAHPPPCRGMSHDPLASCEMRDGECRLARTVWRSCKPIDLALHPCAERHSQESMSPGIDPKCDIRALACRSGSSRSATFEPLHVARDRRAVRHSSLCMSLDALVKGGMVARVCRLTHVCRATCVDAHVALPARLERHGARCMSLDPRGHLSIHGPAERHVRPSMSLHAIAECDMGAQACRCTRGGQATFPRGKRRTPVRRTRAARSRRRGGPRRSREDRMPASW